MKSKKKIKSGWKEYFNFSTREKKGAFYLALIITIQLSLLLALRFYRPEMSPVEKEKFFQVMAELNDSALITKSVSFHQRNEAVHPIPFDPNTADESVLAQNGLSEKQIRVVKNFVRKGGKFRIKNDVSRIYAIDQKTFALIKPYFLLPDTFFQHKNVKAASIVELSSADSATLVDLKGIGPAMASRILKYREKLGGFISVDQLKEVYGMNDTLFAYIQSQVRLNEKSQIKKVNLNTDTVTVLMNHPYIRYKIANGIVNYRRQHGRINSLEDLQKLAFVPEEILRKLAPYLNF